MTERIAILAGGGRLPLVLADSIVSRGGRAHIVGVRGEAGPEIEAYPHTWVTWGAVNAILTTLKRESNSTMMIAGSVSRPDLKRLKPDLGVIRYLPSVLAMLKGGDDAVLTRLIRFFESQGLTVKGVADVAPQLLAAPGLFSSDTAAASYDANDMPLSADAALGFAVLDKLADLDVGQAIGVHNGRILAIEGVEGTDRMLARIASLGARCGRGGVVIKGPKRGQDLRVDMPTVGAETISRLAEAGIGELVIVADKTLLLDRDSMRDRAAQKRVVVRGVARPQVNDGTLARRSRRDLERPVLPGTLLGRIVPNPADCRDVRTAVEVIERLVSFDTGRASVVVRDHVLAVSAAEGPIGLAQRIAVLRQWGSKRRGRGAAAVLVDENTDEPHMLANFIEALAGAGLAGVAVARSASKEPTSPQPVVSASAVAAADRLQLFLVEIAIDVDRQSTPSLAS